MKTIWKYPLEITDEQVVEMPQGANILSVQSQGSQLCLWAIVFPNRASMRERTITIYGTGHAMRTDCEEKFLATVQQDGGALVWHVFERV